MGAAARALHADSDLRTALQGGVTMMISLGLGRFSIGLLLEPMRDGLGWSYTQAGVLATMNLSAYLLGVLIVPALARRWGYLALRRAAFLLVIVGFVLLASASLSALLLLGAASAGLSGAFAYISAAALGAASQRTARRGLLYGLTGVGVGLGIVIASVLGLVLSDGDGIAWRRAWLLHALLAILGLLTVVRRRAPSPPLRARQPGLIRIPGFARLVLAYGAFAVGYVLFSTYLVAATLGAAASFRAGALVWLVYGIGAMGGGLLFGWLSDRVGRPQLLVAMQFAGAAGCGLVVLGGGTFPALAFIAALVMGSLTMGMTGLMPASLADRLPADLVGDVFALLTLFFAAVQSVVPLVGGGLIDVTGGFEAVFLVAAIAYVLAGTAFRGVRTFGCWGPGEVP